MGESSAGDCIFIAFLLKNSKCRSFSNNWCVYSGLPLMVPPLGNGKYRRIYESRPLVRGKLKAVLQRLFLKIVAPYEEWQLMMHGGHV